MAVRGSNAYIGEGASFVVLNMSAPVSPTVQGKTLLPGDDVWDIDATERYAYIADGSAGLRIVDITDPAYPVEIGFYDTPGSTIGVAVAGDYAYLADGNAGLRIVDIADPAHPMETGFYDMPDWVSDVTLSGTLAYVADGSAGLQVIDVTNPGFPTEVSVYDMPGLALDVVIANNYAYVADDYKGLRIIDISVPTHLSEVGFYETAQAAQGVAIDGSHAYLATTSGGLRVVDISSPLRPTEVGFHLGAAWAQDVAIAQGWAFVADLYGRLWILDVTDPAHPIERSSYRVPYKVDAIAAASDYVYAADYSAEQLWIIDGTTSPNPTAVGIGNLSTTGWFGSMTVAGGYAYVIDNSSGLHVVDVSAPSQPYEVATYLPWPTGVSPSFRNVVVQSDNAYMVGTVAEYPASQIGVPIFTRGYLWIIDVSQPTLPSEVGYYRAAESNSSINGVAIVGNYAYVVGDRLRVIDISHPMTPTLVSSAAVPGWEIAVVGHYAYIPSGDVLHIVDITTPTHSTEISVYNAPGVITALTLDQKNAYVMIDNNRLHVLDLSTPTVPREMLLYVMPRDVSELVVRGAAIYAADPYAGLFILKPMRVYLPLMLRQF